jgi:hypothetical protein
VSGNPPTEPVPELPVRPLAGVSSPSSWALDAHGTAAFIVGEFGFVVVDLR